MDLSAVLTIVSGLVGFPALLAAVIDILKKFGLVADGDAPKWNLGGNVLAVVAVAVAVILGKVEVVGQVDAVLGSVATFLLAIFAFAASIGLTKLFHFGLRGVPGIGYSHTLKK